MKLWSRILGAIALALTLFLAVNWPIDHFAAIKAAKSEAEFSEEAGTWVNVAIMDREHLRSVLQTHMLKLEGAQIEENIASLQGRSPMQARLEQQKQRALIQSDRMMIDMNNLSSPEDDPRAANARERAAAAASSRIVYANGQTRDEHLAYVAGFLWLCFGFAVALQKR